MNIKEKIKSVGFWSALIGTIFLMLSAFGVEIGDETASTVINAVCSALVMFGIVTSPAKSEATDEKDETENGESDKGDGAQ